MKSTNKKPTIKDIQVLTGLSLGCISKYLNGGNVINENRIKIEDAINKLGYTVDIYARGMITGHTKCIGLIIPEFSNTFYGILASNISKALHDKGYDVMVNEHYGNVDIERKIIHKLFSRRVDAVILVPTSLKKETYSNYKGKLIFLDSFIEGLDADFVVVNNKDIAKQATDYLISMGHTKIAGLFSEDTYTGLEREKGFVEALKEHNIDPKDHTFRFKTTINNAYTAIKEILAMKKYTAVFTSNYIATLGAVFYLNEKNIDIPKEISLVGFDNIMLTSLYHPSLTIVNQPMDEIAIKVVERTLEAVNKTRSANTIDVLTCELEKNYTVKKI